MRFLVVIGKGVDEVGMDSRVDWRCICVSEGI